MKQLLCLLLSLLVAVPAYAVCFNTTPGLVYVTGRQTTRIHFAHGRYVDVACTLRKPGYIYWRGGVICKPGVVYGWSGGPFACRILKIQ